MKKKQQRGFEKAKWKGLTNSNEDDLGKFFIKGTSEKVLKERIEIIEVM